MMGPFYCCYGYSRPNSKFEAFPLQLLAYLEINNGCTTETVVKIDDWEGIGPRFG
jgi:hypothetical protein